MYSSRESSAPPDSKIVTFGSRCSSARSFCPDARASWKESTTESGVSSAMATQGRIRTSERIMLIFMVAWLSVSDANDRLSNDGIDYLEGILSVWQLYC